MESAPVLSFDGVSLSFDETPALRNVSFSVGSGESLIVLGAASSGKTTLLKVALGLLRPDSGSVHLFGQDVTALDETDWYDVRSRIGVLFQEGGLFDSLTIEENVSYPFRYQRLLQLPEEEIAPRVQQSLEFVELGHTLEKFPSELSGGMRRRVGIARAIVTQPQLMLYDSPTAGLDPITANNIVALIVKGRDLRHATTLMITHRAQDGEIMAGYRFDPQSQKLAPSRNGERVSTRYIVLREGEVVFDGSPADFAASRDPYVVRFGMH